MTHLYILLSETKTRTYTGVAADVEKRLREHNTGKVTSSRPYRPHKIIHTKTFNTLSEARQEERFYKSPTGRRRLKSLITSLEECTVNISLQPDGSLPSTLL